MNQWYGKYLFESIYLVDRESCIWVQYFASHTGKFVSNHVAFCTQPTKR